MTTSTSTPPTGDRDQLLIALGSNIRAPALANAGARTASKIFQGLNFARLNVFKTTADVAAKLRTRNDAITEQSVALSFGDHNFAGALGGADLNSAAPQYADWANIFKATAPAQSTALNGSILSQDTPEMPLAAIGASGGHAAAASTGIDPIYAAPMNGNAEVAVHSASSAPQGSPNNSLDSTLSPSLALQTSASIAATGSTSVAIAGKTNGVVAAAAVSNLATSPATALTVSNGRIVENGKTFVAKGINIYAPVLISAGAAAITSTFPGLNFIRVNVFDMTANETALLKPVVNALTAQGVVVELEDHTTGTVLTGAALQAAVQRYTDWATTFKGNANVVFGTQNEPVGSAAAIDGEISALYNAIRATGNNSLVMMNPYSGNSTTGLVASTFASMTNVAWDIHYYSNLSGLSTSLSANESALANTVAGAGGIKSANGVIPTIVGEYGPAPGNGVSPGGDQAVAAVEASGLGSLAWAWETGNPAPYPGDLVQSPWTGGPTMLTSYGKSVAHFIATGTPSPIAGNANLYIAPSQSLALTSQLLALDTPGEVGDSLKVTAVGSTAAHGTATLAAGILTYTAPASGAANVFTYTASDQRQGSATGNVNVTLSPNLNTSASINLTGPGNIVLGGAGNDAISGGTGANWISLGNGRDTVATPGDNNTITLGNGADAVSVNGAGNVVTVGSGNDTITSGPAGSSGTFTLNGATAALVLNGSNNKVFVNGGTDSIYDSIGSVDHLSLNVGSAGGSIFVDNFSAASGIVDLTTAMASGLHWSTAAQIDSALTSDHGGGSLLSLGSDGSIDFLGVATTALHAANFRIG